MFIHGQGIGFALLLSKPHFFAVIFFWVDLPRIVFLRAMNIYLESSYQFCYWHICKIWISSWKGRCMKCNFGEDVCSTSAPAPIALFLSTVDCYIFAATTHLSGSCGCAFLTHFSYRRRLLTDTTDAEIVHGHPINNKKLLADLTGAYTLQTTDERETIWGICTKVYFP